MHPTDRSPSSPLFPKPPSSACANGAGEPFLPSFLLSSRKHLSPRDPQKFAPSGRNPHGSPRSTPEWKSIWCSCGGSEPAPAGRDRAPEPPLTVPLAFPLQRFPVPARPHSRQKGKKSGQKRQKMCLKQTKI